MTIRTNEELDALHQVLNDILLTEMEQECLAMQKEIEAIRAEIAEREARIFADNQHLFTITFPGPRLALLEVRGAASQDHAREIAWSAFPGCLFTISDGDQTSGHAAYFYLWCSSAAQEAQPRREASA